jgi:hypothetical protein
MALDGRVLVRSELINLHFAKLGAGILMHEWWITLVIARIAEFYPSSRKGRTFHLGKRRRW